MDFKKVCVLRRWCSWTDQIENFDVELLAAIHNPTGYNMADLGFYLLNEVRKDLELPVLDENFLVKE